jgi:glyoxylase-like metal-dependent hydrolase (beta-lactamase superfamily II)
MRKLGEFRLDRVVESEEPLIEPQAFFPQSDPETFAAHAHWLEPRHVDPASGKLVICVQSYLVRTPRHTILVDACVGDDKARADRFPQWHMRKWGWLETLARAGVAPEQVDFVLCTHLHIDHVGWNTRLKDGRWVPTFPNARYIFARKEAEHWEARMQAGEQGGHPQAYLDSVLPVIEAGQAVLVEGDHEIDHGVWFEPAPGHTEGNVVVNLRSGGARGVLLGDVIHHPIQLVRPDWSSRACEDRELSHRTRRGLLERYAGTDVLLAPAHFATPSFGRVRAEGDRFGWLDLAD